MDTSTHDSTLYADPHKSYYERHGIKDIYETVCMKLVRDQPRSEEVTNRIVQILSGIRDAKVHPRKQHNTAVPHVVFVLYSQEALGSRVESFLPSLCRELRWGYLDANTLTLDANLGQGTPIPVPGPEPTSQSGGISGAQNNTPTALIRALQRVLELEMKQVVVVVNFAQSIAHAHQFETMMFRPSGVVYISVSDELEWWAQGKVVSPALISTNLSPPLPMSAEQAFEFLCTTVRPVAEFYRARCEIEQAKDKAPRYSEFCYTNTMQSDECRQGLKEVLQKLMSEEQC